LLYSFIKASFGTKLSTIRIVHTVCAWGSNLIPKPKPKLKDEMIQKFKKIRKMKMKPAHEVEEN